MDGERGDPTALVEVKPKRTIEFWVNVYPENTNEIFETKEQADEASFGYPRTACLHFTREFEKGEGL